MSSSKNSLSALIYSAKEIEKFLAMKPDEIDRGIFERAQEHINRMQVWCPNFDEVVEARVTWYLHALDRFVRYCVEPAERGVWTSMNGMMDLRRDDPPELVAGTRTLDDFLRRSYLKHKFPVCYERLLSAYQRLARSPIPAVNKGCFDQKVMDLTGDLLNGRF